LYATNQMHAAWVDAVSFDRKRWNNLFGVMFLTF